MKYKVYKHMWEELKEYIEQYENENEISYIMQQIEELHLGGENNE